MIVMFATVNAETEMMSNCDMSLPRNLAVRLYLDSYYFDHIFHVVKNRIGRTKCKCDQCDICDGKCEGKDVASR